MSQDIQMSNRYLNKVVLITGGSRGIGLAVAERIIKEGGKVCITGRRQVNLDHALEFLGGNQNAMGVIGASHDEIHQVETITRVIDNFGQIDLLVNNVGINPAYGSILEIDLEVARRILDVNVVGTLSWIQKTYAMWFKDFPGSIVNVSSVAGLLPANNIGMYGTSKAAIVHLTQQLASELGPRIRVNAVAPAVVKTKFAEVLYEKDEGALAATYPLKRLGVPEDVASAVSYLGSSDASWVTGQTFIVDGGLMLGGGV